MAQNIASLYIYISCSVYIYICANRAKNSECHGMTGLKGGTLFFSNCANRAKKSEYL